MESDYIIHDDSNRQTPREEQTTTVHGSVSHLPLLLAFIVCQKEAKQMQTVAYLWG